MVKTYDQKCWNLAVDVLADDDKSTCASIHSLALAIQQAVEDWKEDEATEHAEQAEKDAELKQLRGLSDAERERI